MNTEAKIAVYDNPATECRELYVNGAIEGKWHKDSGAHMFVDVAYKAGAVAGDREALPPSQTVDTTPG